MSAEPHDQLFLYDREQVASQMVGTHCGLAYGQGKSYGDVCLNPGGLLWETTGLDRFISFNPESGLLACESGVLLRDIQRLAVPHGWILPVTPGTQLITVGGAIANDVHGKNHHRAGTFGDHIVSITLARTDGSTIRCGPQDHADWYFATLGGVGLTGVITSAEIQLKQVAGPWLDTETIPFSDVSEFFQLADQSEAAWEQTVAWIDCRKMGRGLFMRGRTSATGDGTAPGEGSVGIPLTPPVSLINRMSVSVFNSIYFNCKKRLAGPSVAHYESFLYPLDRILQWNRMYGPRGFYQYQSLVPRENGRDALAAMLKETSRAGEGSFLSVLKTFGEKKSAGLMSFAGPGVSLALDFANRGLRTLKLFERLDAIVREAGGRLYLAKDARMPRDLFEAGYPKLGTFLQYRDPGISSALSRRLMGY